MIILSFRNFWGQKNGPTMVEVPGRRNDINILHPNQEFNLYLYNQQRALTVLTVTDVAVWHCKVQSGDVVLSEFVCLFVFWGVEAWKSQSNSATELFMQLTVWEGIGIGGRRRVC